MSQIIYCGFAFVIFLNLVTLTSSTEDGCVDLNCSGQKYTAKSTAFYPSTNPAEGGYYDCQEKAIQTLQQYLDGQASYVSVAIDPSLDVTYGTTICIPELNEKYQQHIVFKVVDTASSFCGKGLTRINIAVDTEGDAYDASVNRDLSLVFSDLQYGSPSCSYSCDKK